MSEVLEPKTYEEKRQELLKLWEKQRIQAKSAKWYQKHKEEKLASRKEYRKEHYADKKDKINAKSKKYYAENKAMINEKAAAKLTCDICGSIVRKRRMTDHKRTIKCKAIQEKQALETQAEITE